MHSRLGRRCGGVVLLAAAAAMPAMVFLRSASAQEPVSVDSKPRQLAPGVLHVIPPGGEPGDAHTGPVPLVEIIAGIPNLEWTPNFEPKSQTLFERAKKVNFYRPIWSLEFAFKPLRMIEIDVPDPDTKTMRRKPLWYMI